MVELAIAGGAYEGGVLAFGGQADQNNRMAIRAKEGRLFHVSLAQQLL